MKKEKKFIIPECEIIYFHTEDIITDSDPHFPGNIDEGSTENTPLM